eukprot:SAG11_NODE_9904_length_871_cov_1.204663_1_plen_62_part_00
MGLQGLEEASRTGGGLEPVGLEGLGQGWQPSEEEEQEPFTPTVTMDASGHANFGNDSRLFP